MNKATIIYFNIVRGITIILLGTAIYGMIASKFNSIYLGDYVLVILNAIGLLVLSFAPKLLKHYNLEIPNVIINVYFTLITMAMLFGEIFGFYKNVKGWDSIIHFSSGTLIAMIGISLISLFNNDNKNLKLSPIFIVLFGFCFAMTVGVFWEIFEYAMDGLFGGNMQRFRDNHDATKLFLGRHALMDTMKDFILNALGATVTSIITYIDLKREGKFVTKLSIKKDDSK